MSFSVGCTSTEVLVSSAIAVRVYHASNNIGGSNTKLIEVHFGLIKGNYGTAHRS